jgi:hypothetical protein
MIRLYDSIFSARLADGPFDREILANGGLHMRARRKACNFWVGRTSKFGAFDR